ncbi:type II toxin-antitoxin system VapC family toxin [Sphingobium terrigena]|uniref:type II toxin-antitoxin system VapC family toxin n=1 Tax=Sphingobium terrigena TaxID=2304063 RepID=UPI001600B956|nr:type II toxin-antitoxin system VapC family toxin [Sphingobium terrigena]
MIILDSSALLAVLLGEKGADAVLPVMRESILSSVNLSETLERGIAQGHAAQKLVAQIERFGVDIRPFDRDQALIAADLRAVTRSRGLSLGDRACLALARSLDAPVLTADQVWAELDIGIDIRLIR